MTRRRMAGAERALQILDVAEELLGVRGFAAMSMDELAQRAGVTKPVVYDHFPSKQGLIAAVIERSGDELQRRAEEAVAAAAGPEDALARGIHAYFSFIDERRSAWLAVLTEAPLDSAAGQALETVRAQQAAYVASLIRREVPEVAVETALVYANTVVGACERIATYAVRTGTLSPQQATAHVMDVIWMGFSALSDGRRWPAGG